MMWSLRRWLASSIMAASVVDLPQPVGPVTSTRPRGREANFDITLGSPKSAQVEILSGISRNTAPIPFFCRK